MKVGLNVQEVINELYDTMTARCAKQKEIFDKHNFIPKFCIINANPEDEGSKIYLKNKIALLEKYGIEVEHCILQDDYSIIRNKIQLCNRDRLPVILQLPLGPKCSIHTQTLLDAIYTSLDVDGLSNMHDRLPITSSMLYYIIKRIEKKAGSLNGIFLRGNGKTTNKGLIQKLLLERGDIFVSNSKTPPKMEKIYIQNSELIISATGIPNSLKSTDDFKIMDKILISPTVLKVDGKWANDIDDNLRKPWNYTHNITGAIGKLTLIGLCDRIQKYYLYSYKYGQES